MVGSAVETIWLSSVAMNSAVSKRTKTTTRRRGSATSETKGAGVGVGAVVGAAAAVCGVYFAHPDTRYFTVGKIGRDQVEDYARRKGWTLAEAERWLAPNLAYTPT